MKVVPRALLAKLLFPKWTFEPMEEGDKQAVGNDTDGDADQMLRQRKNSKKESKSRYAECLE